jgi:hypothetical protein
MYRVEHVMCQYVTYTTHGFVNSPVRIAYLIFGGADESAIPIEANNGTIDY